MPVLGDGLREFPGEIRAASVRIREAFLPLRLEHLASALTERYGVPFVADPTLRVYPFEQQAARLRAMVRSLRSSGLG